jgi:hypothetical protein
MRTTIVVLAAAMATVGCGASDSQKASQTAADAAKPAAQTAPQGTQPAQSGAQQASQGAQSVAQGLQQLAKGLQQTGSDGKPVPPVDFEKLQALLPAPSGWEMGKPKGEQVTMGISISDAEVTYKKDASNVTLKITDSAFSPLVMAGMSMMMSAGYSERTSSGYKKSMTMNGSPGYEEWNSDDKHGQVTIVVANRFVVEGTGSHLDSIDSLRGIVQQVDMAKLTALK